MDGEEYEESYGGHEMLCWNEFIRSSETGLWQSEPGRNSMEDGDLYVGSSNETNVIKLLNSREIGPNPLFSTRTLRNRALAELLKDRWQCADGLTLFEEATQILDRRLYRWEGEALNHLLGIDFRHVRQTEENKQLTNFISKASHHQCPIGFTDILEVLHINGIDFNRHRFRVNVLVTIFVNGSCGKDVEEAIRFLAGHGLDLIESGHAALMEFCRGFTGLAYHIGMSCLLKVLELLVRLGFPLDAQSHRGSLIKFLRCLSTAKEEIGHAVEIYKFFIDNGFGIDGAFEAICSYGTLLDCMRSAEMFDTVLATFRLLHTSSSTSMHFENDEEKQDMLRLFSKDWCEREDLTLSDLIRRSTQVGIHSKAIGERNASR